MGQEEVMATEREGIANFISRCRDLTRQQQEVEYWLRNVSDLNSIDPRNEIELDYVSAPVFAEWSECIANGYSRLARAYRNLY